MATEAKDKLATLEILNYYLQKINTACKENYLNKAAVMPVASASIEGKIVQYQGTTGGGYTHGHFYECIKQDDGSFKWQNLLITEGSDENDGTERKVYYGIVDAYVTIDDSLISGLNWKNTTTKKFEYSGINTNNESIIFLTPAAMGVISSIEDDGVGFDYFEDFDLTYVTYGGIDYLAYRLNHNVTLSNFKLTFN